MPQHFASLPIMALASFATIAEIWRLSEDDQRALLDCEPTPAAFTNDTLVRTQHLFRIYCSLVFHYKDELVAAAWLRTANPDAPFKGLTPLDYMLSGDIERLVDVRAFTATLQ